MNTKKSEQLMQELSVLIQAMNITKFQSGNVSIETLRELSEKIPCLHKFREDLFVDKVFQLDISGTKQLMNSAVMIAIKDIENKIRKEVKSQSKTHWWKFWN